jgi:cytidine deaminase
VRMRPDAIATSSVEDWISGLDSRERRLLERARKAASNAYCPYSQFPVGAALECTDGRILEAANVENASYGLSMCAERVCIFSAVASGGRPVLLAVSCLKGDPLSPATLMPCGACRQVISEFLSQQSTIIVDGIGKMRLMDLLPQPFALR